MFFSLHWKVKGADGGGINNETDALTRKKQTSVSKQHRSPDLFTAGSLPEDAAHFMEGSASLT